LRLFKFLLASIAMLLATINARAIELKVTAAAMERTLQQQLFTGPDGRYYLQGDTKSACFVYVDQPSVHFQDDRVVIHVHTHSRLGAGMFGKCVGLGFNTEADVSVVPDAEGETIGFRDARIDRFTGNKELDALLIPFLSRKLPQKLKINAADLLRTALAKSRQSTGYELTLDNLKIHSMLVQQSTLTVDLDGSLRVN
jgi:hypothetical protein